MLLFSLIGLFQHPGHFIIREKYSESRIPLKDFHIDITALDGSAELNFNLKYLNTKNDTLVEAKLLFPFDTDMAVSDVIMKYQDKVFVSAAMKKPEARATYEKEKESNHTSLLVSREHDMLSIQLAAIPPETMVDISFTIYAPLPVLYDTKKETFFSKFVLPLRFIPRYHLQPSNGQDNEPTPTTVSTSENPYNFSIKFNAPNAVKIDYNAATDEKNINIDGNSIQISKVPSKDFSVNIYHQKESSTQVEHLGSSRIVNFKINPHDIPSKKNDREVSMVFLIDCSGSMYGESIANARNALNLFIHSISTNVKFDIVSFGSSYNQMFGELKEYNDETLEKADAYIKQVGANLGGTEILNPLRMILTERKPDIVFLLTDGAVANTNDVLQLVKDFKTRINSLGIGAGADADLVRGLARNSGGSYEFIDQPSQIEGAVIRSLSDAVSPALANAKIESDCGIPLQRFPTVIPKSSISTFSFIGNFEKSDKCSLKISGNIGDDSKFEKILSSDSARPSISSKQLHATTIVRAINDDVINESFALKLSQEHNLMTKVTSLILYDNTTEHNASHIESVDVPAFTESFEGMHFFSMGQPRRFAARPMAAKMAAPQGNVILGNVNHMRSFSSNSMDSADADGDMMMESGSEEKEKKEEKEAKAVCKSLIGAQKASGSWNDIKLVAKAVGKNAADTREAAALAVAFLEGKCGTQFQLVAAKGRAWLESEVGVEEATRLIEAAAKKLGF